MPIAAGSMNQQVQFLRRTAGLYQRLGPAQWGRFEFERPVTINVVGVTFQGRGGKLTVRSCDLTRGLRVGDRCELDGDVFSIIIRKASDIHADDVHLEIESAPTIGLYAQEIDRRGEIVIVRRIQASPAPAIDVPVKAIVTGYAPNELIGGVKQGDSRVILLAADLLSSNLSLPLRSGSSDRVVFGGRVRMLEKIDDNTHRVAGVQLAYDCTVRG